MQLSSNLNLQTDALPLIDLGLFDHRVLNKTKSFIFKIDLEYSPELNEQDDDYPLAPKVMTIEPEITDEKKHNLRDQYFGAACLFSRKLICFFLSKKH